MLRDWFADIAPDAILFPLLAKRRTWLMVKKDLERAGLQYKTKEGVADFHAAGRHTYITQLLRHGASLPEAKELARHTDVKMTMRYAHIGLDDQARALAALPSPPAPTTPDPASSDAQPQSGVVAPGHRANGSKGQNGTPPVTMAGEKSPPQKRRNPRSSKGFGNDSQSQSLAVADDNKWRRRESNPPPPIRLFPAWSLLQLSRKQSAKYAKNQVDSRSKRRHSTLVSSKYTQINYSAPLTGVT
ncbi:tyrosine-type recombinase/integrase [Lacipirellula parvula]|uniref:Tyr recombinase domain-containing protein n=1 Tax=Lacipirellula parvula TaxID=2650471 RepID=A0A5K7XJH0_9BACT|nr:hypothetical protein PLANPX_4813 [Lacipirellula parvula]